MKLFKWFLSDDAKETRNWLYGIGTFATPLLMVYGVVDDKEAVAWLGLLGAVFNQGAAAIVTKVQRNKEQ